MHNSGKPRITRTMRTQTSDNVKICIMEHKINSIRMAKKNGYG